MFTFGLTLLSFGKPAVKTQRHACLINTLFLILIKLTNNIHHNAFIIFFF